ncbi:uncharacterized protein LOC118647637 [Monomorium pharaonis]|uniref:uncharacterized protein LOC118647637 n=1 Tax=Monomorium pharaonis TaxID=307658 RepID=UPI001746DB3E|nr:uncharacterized protein LOC118647637 [Monomorium pharaonis]XP_036148792.1 uncharacterized protein LOC118647637 [Monomorium pharaonis]XP_036148793.1 uncharacterized protein LOC118647637 [Monomorium pharaonis]
MSNVNKMDDESDHSFEYAGASDAKADEQLNLEKRAKEIAAKEKELTRRHELLETMMQAITSALSINQAAAFAASTPSDTAGRTTPPNFPTPSTAAYPPAQPAHDASGFSSVHAYSKSYVRDALELVPKYDGHNIPVWQFARACKRAKESIPLVDEALFVRMLRNKLSHHAYLAVEDETHLTVDKFLDALKRAFGPGRSANYYRGQLSIAYKKPGEHILDFIGRVKDLKTAIIEGDQITFNRPLSEAEINAIEAYALEAFYEGLPREYRLELKAEGNFSEACSKAIIIHKRLKREEARYRNTRNSRADSQTTQPVKIFQGNTANLPSTSSGLREIIRAPPTIRTTTADVKYAAIARISDT